MFVCVYVHMLSATSVRSLLFYEADQTQGVIVIYEAPRCLWRVRLDQKYTLPCQVHRVSTSRHLLYISSFIGSVRNYNSRSKLTILLSFFSFFFFFFRMTVKSLSGVTARLHWKITRETWWNPWTLVNLIVLWDTSTEVWTQRGCVTNVSVWFRTEILHCYRLKSTKQYTGPSSNMNISRFLSCCDHSHHLLLWLFWGLWKRRWCQHCSQISFIELPHIQSMSPETLLDQSRTVWQSKGAFVWHVVCVLCVGSCLVCLSQLMPGCSDTVTIWTPLWISFILQLHACSLFSHKKIG